jgi:hypothetical protein
LAKSGNPAKPWESTRIRSSNELEVAAFPAIVTPAHHGQVAAGRAPGTYRDAVGDSPRSFGKASSTVTAPGPFRAGLQFHRRSLRARGMGERSLHAVERDKILSIRGVGEDPAIFERVDPGVQIQFTLCQL